jgi:FeS assembly SUF system regulator
MLKISKLTDYGTVVMAYLANNNGPMNVHAAKDIAQQTHVALPTVSKLLKLLARAGLLAAHRGVKGGYSLAYRPEAISLAQIIQAMEGDISLTECGHHSGLCAMETLCAIRNNWRTISGVIHDALKSISLADMTKPIINNKTIRQSIVKQLPKIKTSVKTRAYSYDRSRN